jgi:DNA (cytosine-5)-methyltransferase 1
VTAYYNEIDPYAAQWLRNLIDAGLIPAGDVDTRSIEDVIPNELRGYTQCHFFAGIGGWPLALRLAGWPDSRPVWTGSCPCQPFSQAGARAGFDDQRHLWPSWLHLIRECRPSEIFGEQVASKAADPWVDLVQADLEGVGYAFGCVPFPAAAVGAPHVRDRLYWVAHANDARSQGHRRPGWVGSSEGWAPPTGYAPTGWVGECITDRAGNTRLIEPGTRPLAHGVSGRVGRLRAYGNAIVPQAGAEFIAAYIEAVMAAECQEAA